MVSLKVAFRTGVEVLRKFFVVAEGDKISDTSPEGFHLAEKKEINKKGSVLVSLNAPQYATYEEFRDANGGEEGLLRIGNEALIDACKAKVGEIFGAKDAVAEGTDIESAEVRASILSGLTVKAQTEVSRITRIPLSSRQEKLASAAVLADAQEKAANPDFQPTREDFARILAAAMAR